MRSALLLSASLLLFRLLCITASRSTGCTSHMDACVSPDVCRREQTALETCQFTDVQQCNASLQMMLGRSPSLRECVCGQTDSCQTLQQLRSLCHPHLAHKSKQLEAKQRAGDPKGQGGHSSRSCLEEIMSCLEDEACNRQMVPFVQECSSFGCDPSLCRDAVRLFYSSLPHSVAETLVFCDCDGEDRECQQMKASLHSGSCLNEPTETPWTCLEALDVCERDDWCRQAFDSYLSRCFEVEDSVFDSDGDWHHLDPDFILGEDLQCRAAFVETMGSVLHHPCTCDGLHSHDQYKCNDLKHIFQDKSLFKRSKTGEKIPNGEGRESNTGQEASCEVNLEQQKIRGETPRRGESEDLRGGDEQQKIRGEEADYSNTGQQPTRESSVRQEWLSEDQLFYLLICISVLTLVVLLVISLVLHRLWRIHKSAGKATFVAHQSKSLMLSSVII